MVVGVGAGVGVRMLARGLAARPVAALREGAPHLLRVAVVLDDDAQGLLDELARERRCAEGDKRLRPVEGLADARGLAQVEPAQLLDLLHELTGEGLAHAGRLEPDDLELGLGVGVVELQVQTAALERLGELARAVAGEDDERRAFGAQGADLRDRNLEVAQELEQEGLELLVGAVDLVEQQDRPALGPDRLKDRPLDQERLREEDVLLVAQRRRGLAQILRRPDQLADLLAQDLSVEELLAVLPLVQRLGLVEALVALQADQRAVERTGERLGELGLADSRVAPAVARGGEPEAGEYPRDLPLLRRGPALGPEGVHRGIASWAVVMLLRRGPALGPEGHSAASTERWARCFYGEVPRWDLKAVYGSFQ